MTMPHTTTESLVDGLIEQRELFRALDALAERQASLVSEERTDELLVLMAERQAIIDRIVAIGRRLERPLQEPGATAHPEIRSLLDEIQVVARRVHARDDSHRTTMEKRRDQLSAEMAGVGAGRAAVAAYSTRPRETVARFKDTEA